MGSLGSFNLLHFSAGTALPRRQVAALLLVRSWQIDSVFPSGSIAGEMAMSRQTGAVREHTSRGAPGNHGARLIRCSGPESDCRLAPVSTLAAVGVCVRSGAQGGGATKAAAKVAAREAVVGGRWW